MENILVEWMLSVYNGSERNTRTGGTAMRCWTAKTRHSGIKYIWIVLLLLILESAAVSGKIKMATYLPHAVEGQTTSAAICTIGTVTQVAALSAAPRDAEIIGRAGIGEQRVQQRAVSRTCIPICGIFVLFLYRLVRRLLYRLSNQQSHRRSNFMISYQYNLSYL